MQRVPGPGDMSIWKVSNASMALVPELVHGFLGKLRGLGASGVIGTEITVWTIFSASA